MLWETIGNLPSNELRQRADELRNRLLNFNDANLLEFYREATSAFLSLFNPSIYYLYCGMFAGEVNGSGLTDFCSNIILAGHELFEKIMANPDNFANVPNITPFNDDYCLSPSEICRTLLIARHGEQMADELINAACIDQMDSIWEHLEKNVGPLTFEPAWNILQTTMPKVYARCHS